MFSDVPYLMSVAYAILQKRRDHDLIEKLTIVQGYSQLLEVKPHSLYCQEKLQRAVEELRVLVEAMQSELVMMP